MTKLKITFTKSDNKVTPSSISVREPLVEDFIEAQKYGDNMKMTAALIAQICTFDGKQITMEEVAKLPVTDFFGIVDRTNFERISGLERSVIYLVREGRFSYESVMRMCISDLTHWTHNLSDYIHELNKQQKR